MSDQLDLTYDDTLAAALTTHIGSMEYWHHPIHTTPRVFSLGLENEDSSVLMKLLESLIRFLKRMMSDIADGSVSMDINLNRIITRADLLNAAGRFSNTTGDTSFKITTRIDNLCLNHKPMNDPQRLLMALKAGDLVVRRYFKWQTDELIKIVPSILTLNPGSPDDLTRLIDLMSNVSPISYGASAGFAEQGPNRIGPHLLGNQQLVALCRDPDGDVLEQLLSQTLVLQPSDAEQKPTPEYIQYDRFARTIERSIVKQVEATATDLVSRISMSARRRRHDQVDSLIRYLDLLRNNIASGNYQGEALHNANAFVQLIEAYDNWLVSPYLSLLSLSCRNMSAILNVCEANN